MNSDTHGTARHTPGPWQVVSKFVGPLQIQADDETVIALVGSETFEGCAANAELIAAAPNMLAALKYIGGKLSEATLAERRLTKDETFALLSWATSAVAKAEGHTDA